METPFKEQNFKLNDVVLRSDLDQEQQNLQWLKVNTPRGRWYGAQGISDAYVTIICGSIYFAASKNESRIKKSVNFGKAFAPGCNPNVATGMISSIKNIYAIVNGPGGGLLPTSQGFELTIEAAEPGKTWAISKPFYVHWQAMGYRTPDL